MSYNWQNTLISAESELSEALKIIDNEALRIALVVDDKQKLLGVVTDGDIRRALLNHRSLSTKVSEIMNFSPVTAKAISSREELVAVMEEKGILSIPLIDDSNVVLGLETLQRVTKPTRKNPVFIMAGGFGTRLRPLTDNCPKPMLKIGDKPFLETLIRAFKRFGFVDFYISTHFMPEQIHAHFKDGQWLGVNITYVHEDEPLGTGGALGLLPSSLPKDLPLIMINGDILTKVDFGRLLDFHISNRADATMCVREYEYQIPYGVVQGDGKKIIDLVEKPIQKFFVNAGIYVLSPNVIQSVSKNKRIDLPSILEKFVECRDKVFMFPVHEYWLDIGRMEDFNRAQVDIHSLGLLGN